jgi:K+-sensing histidine kinase KdpD
VSNQTQERIEPLPTLPRVVSLAVHELRTPVTVVAGYLRMLLREQAGPLNDKQRKMLEEAERSCARLGAVIAEMSELGKLEANELGLARMSFDLAALVAEAAAGVHDEDRGVRVEIRGTAAPAGQGQLDTGRVMVTGDRARIGAAIRALVHAAVRERIEPGVLVAECNIVDRWGVVAIGDEALLPTLTRDAGAAAGTAPSGFDEWRGGMGLALPVACRVLAAHGGNVWSVVDGAQRAAALRLPLVQ